MIFSDNDCDTYEFDFIWSYGQKYVEVTHHYKYLGGTGWTRFAVKIENKIILWDHTHPVSPAAINYINRTHKMKTFL